MVVALSLAVPAFATGIVYEDISEGQWFYNGVMEMTRMGLFNGKGKNTIFAPADPMTVAEFLKVIVVALYQEEVNDLPAGQYWFSKYYDVALNHNLISETEYQNTVESLGKAVTRQEMALLIVRAAQAKGETIPTDLVYPEQIPDIDDIGSPYLKSARIAYTMGFITGKDGGKFDPSGSMTRAEASTVLYRLVDATQRKATTPKKSSSGTGVGNTSPTTSVQSWVEGQSHGEPHAGDTITLSTRAKVVLKEKWGVLGAGQGVDLYTGYNRSGVALHEGTVGIWDDTVLTKAKNGTNELHTSNEWSIIRSKSYPTGKVGDYDGEVYNTFWQWSADFNRWMWLGGN